MIDSYDDIKKCASLMNNMSCSSGGVPGIFLRCEKKIFSLKSGVDFGNISDTDIEEVTACDNVEVKLLEHLPEFTAIIRSETPYVKICIDSDHEMNAILDDMAMIVGDHVNIVPKKLKCMEKELGKVSGVMVKDDGLYTAGRDLKEAYLAMIILEKSAEILLKGQSIGGVSPIKKSEAKKLHKTYYKSYRPQDDGQKKEGGEDADEQ